MLCALRFATNTCSNLSVRFPLLVTIISLFFQKYFQQWQTQEETFHLEQARLRSKIRIKDGRATAVDLIARYLDVYEGKEVPPEAELYEPYVYMNGLSKNALEDLLADIEVSNYCFFNFLSYYFTLIVFPRTIESFLIFFIYIYYII